MRLTIEQPNDCGETPFLDVRVDSNLVARMTVPGPWEPLVFIPMPGLDADAVVAEDTAVWDEIRPADLTTYLFAEFGVTEEEFALAYMPWIELADAEPMGLPS